MKSLFLSFVFIAVVLSSCDDSEIENENLKSKDSFKESALKLDGNLKIASGMSGTVFVGSLINDSLYALDALTGAKKWSTSLNGDIYSSPTVDSGTVFIGSYDKKIYAFDQVTGSLKWNAKTGDVIKSSPIVSGGKVFIASDKLYAFNAITGSLDWVKDLGHVTHSSPTIVAGIFNNETLYIENALGLYAIDASTGALHWSIPITGTCSPAVVSGIVYVGSQDSSLYAIDATTGVELWKAKTGNMIYSSPTVDNGLVYVGSYDNKLYAFDAIKGTWIWDASLQNAVISSPTVSGQLIYVVSGDKLYAFDSLSGSLKWTTKTITSEGSSPTVAYGWIFVGAEAFDKSTGSNMWISPFVLSNVISSPCVVSGQDVFHPGISGDHQ